MPSMPDREVPDVIFEVAAERLELPTAAIPPDAKAKWRQRDAKSKRIQCMDCVRYAHEMSPMRYPAIRSAVVIRVAHGYSDFLCTDHGQLHREQNPAEKEHLRIEKETERVRRNARQG